MCSSSISYISKGEKKTAKKKWGYYNNKKKDREVETRADCDGAVRLRFPWMDTVWAPNFDTCFGPKLTGSKNIAHFQLRKWLASDPTATKIPGYPRLPWTWFGSELEKNNIQSFFKITKLWRWFHKFIALCLIRIGHCFWFHVIKGFTLFSSGWFNFYRLF